MRSRSLALKQPVAQHHKRLHNLDTDQKPSVLPLHTMNSLITKENKVAKSRLAICAFGAIEARAIAESENERVFSLEKFQVDKYQKCYSTQRITGTSHTSNLVAIPQA